MRIQDTQKILKEARSSEHMHEQERERSFRSRLRDMMPDMKVMAGVLGTLSAAAIGLLAVSRQRQRHRFALPW